jgi:hypothetical protein
MPTEAPAKGLAPPRKLPVKIPLPSAIEKRPPPPNRPGLPPREQPKPPETAVVRPQPEPLAVAAISQVPATPACRHSKTTRHICRRPLRWPLPQILWYPRLLLPLPPRLPLR